jgi:hypothetical protein
LVVAWAFPLQSDQPAARDILPTSVTSKPNVGMHRTTYRATSHHHQRPLIGSAREDMEQRYEILPPTESAPTCDPPVSCARYASHATLRVVPTATPYYSKQGYVGQDVYRPWDVQLASEPAKLCTTCLCYHHSGSIAGTLGS